MNLDPCDRRCGMLKNSYRSKVMSAEQLDFALFRHVLTVFYTVHIFSSRKLLLLFREFLKAEEKEEFDKT